MRRLDKVREIYIFVGAIWNLWHTFYCKIVNLLHQPLAFMKRYYLKAFIFRLIADASVAKWTIDMRRQLGDGCLTHIMHLLRIDSDRNNSFFTTKGDRNLGNNRITSIGINYEQVHNTWPEVTGYGANVVGILSVGLCIARRQREMMKVQFKLSQNVVHYMMHV